MLRKTNPVQVLIRNVVRLVIGVPLWLLLSFPFLRSGFIVRSTHLSGGKIFYAIVMTIFVLWIANTFAKMFHILPEWERLVLLRLGKFHAVRGPGLFIIPPFIYSVARIIDIRIMTYEVKATKTLTRDNVPVDVTAAIELEVEDPEKAAIKVMDYWKTTEWSGSSLTSRPQWSSRTAAPCC